MTDLTAAAARENAPKKKTSILELDDRTKRRNAAEGRFKMYGAICIGIAVLALIFLMSSIIRNGSGAFFQTFISLDIELLEDKLDKNGNRDLAALAARRPIVADHAWQPAHGLRDNDFSMARLVAKMSQTMRKRHGPTAGKTHQYDLDIFFRNCSCC